MGKITYEDKKIQVLMNFFKQSNLKMDFPDRRKICTSVAQLLFMEEYRNWIIHDITCGKLGFQHISHQSSTVDWDM